MSSVRVRAIWRNGGRAASRSRSITKSQERRMAGSHCIPAPDNWSDRNHRSGPGCMDQQAVPSVVQKRRSTMSIRHDGTLGRFLVLGVLCALSHPQVVAGTRQLNLERVTHFGGTLLPPGPYTLAW